MKTIEHKLLQTVTITVMIGFLLVALGSSIYFRKVLLEQIVNDEKQKIALTANQLRYIQESAINVARQVAVDSEIQGNVKIVKEQSVFETVLKQNDVRLSLAKYKNMFPYIENIIIISKDEKIFSSNSRQGEFSANNSDWYWAFKNHNVKKGFSIVHNDTLESQSYLMDVFSYILTFTEIQNNGKVIGDIIVNINLNSMMDDLNIDMSLLDSYCLYDRWGNIITSSGEMEADFEQISKDNKTQIALDSGDIVLKNTDFNDNWILVSEVSHVRLTQKLLWVYIFFFAVFFLMIIILPIVLTKLIRNITRPIQQLHLLAIAVGQGDFDVSATVETNDELQILGDAFNVMVKNVKNLMLESVEYEKITKELEINQLMLQINPHFIYNTLNSIVYMSDKAGNEDVVKFTNAFISLLQDTLKVGSQYLYVTVEKELENIKNYLILQKYRYYDKFEVTIDCPKEILQCMIPNIFIQPIVENAIFHGLIGKRGKGNLRIWMEKEEQNLKIHIDDDGIGMSEEQIQKVLINDESITGRMRKIGMANVQQRIRHIYGEQYGITIASEVGKGTSVTMTIPNNK